jgi:N-methylhydantoinase B/oxoprolinase/acetone carboxylase alpha subunit
MKKFVLMMMAVAFSLASFAQQGGQRREFNPESMATRRADQVKEATKLNDEQYKKVYDLFLKQSKDMQAKMSEGGGGFGAFNMEDMQKQQEATNKALKEILSEEQYKAYQKAQEEMMKRFQQGGGFGG